MRILQVSKPRKGANGQLIDKGGKTIVTIKWKDAPAFYISSCVDQKDKFDYEAFQEMFEVLKIHQNSL